MMGEGRLLVEEVRKRGGNIEARDFEKLQLSMSPTNHCVSLTRCHFIWQEPRGQAVGDVGEGHVSPRRKIWGSASRLEMRAGLGVADLALRSENRQQAGVPGLRKEKGEPAQAREAAPDLTWGLEMKSHNPPGRSGGGGRQARRRPWAPETHGLGLTCQDVLGPKTSAKGGKSESYRVLRKT